MIEECLPYINKMELFQEFTPHERNMLASIADLRRLEAGEVLATEGEPADCFFIIADGRVAIMRRQPDGEYETLYHMGPGRLVGQVPLVDGGPLDDTLRAERASIVLAYPRAEFERHYQAGSRYCFKLLDVVLSQLSEQLRDADHVLSSLAGDAADSEEKLRSLLDQLLASADDVERAAVRR